MKRQRRSNSNGMELRSHFGSSLIPVVANEGDKQGSARRDCKYCFESVSDITTRLHSHLHGSCKVYNCRTSEGNGFISRSKAPMSMVIITYSSNECTPSSMSTPSSKKDLTLTGSSSSSIKDLFPSCRVDTSDFEFKLARAGILKGQPFDVLSGPFYAEAFKCLPFNFQPASAEYVRNVGLPQVYEAIQLEGMTRLVKTAQAIALTSDGWTDRKHQSIHNLIVCYPHPFYHSRH